MAPHSSNTWVGALKEFCTKNFTSLVCSCIAGSVSHTMCVETNKGQCHFKPKEAIHTSIFFLYWPHVDLFRTIWEFVEFHQKKFAPDISVESTKCKLILFVVYSGQNEIERITGASCSSANNRQRRLRTRQWPKILNTGTHIDAGPGEV